MRPPPDLAGEEIGLDVLLSLAERVDRLILWDELLDTFEGPAVGVGPEDADGAGVFPLPFGPRDGVRVRPDGWFDRLVLRAGDPSDASAGWRARVDDVAACPSSSVCFRFLSDDGVAHISNCVLRLCVSASS